MFIKTRNNFSADDMSSTRAGTYMYSNADGAASSGSGNLVQQIMDLTAKVTSLNQEKIKKQQEIAEVQPKITRSNQRGSSTYKCNGGGHPWEWSDGSPYCGSDADRLYAQAAALVTANNARLSVIDNEIKAVQAQLDALNKTAPDIVKNDPQVIQAQAAAAAATSAAESKSTTIKYVAFGAVGLVLLLVIGAIIVKVKSTKK